MIPYSFIDWINNSIQPAEAVEPKVIRESLIELIVSVHELNTRLGQIERRIEMIEMVRR